MWSGPCVATTMACGGLFGLTLVAFGSDSWNDGAPELNPATSRTMKTAMQTTASTTSRPPRLESPLLRGRARTGRLVARDEAIARTVAKAGAKRPAGKERTMLAHARGGQDPDPALDPARRPAGAAALPLGRRRRRQARPLPPHRRSADRALP